MASASAAASSTSGGGRLALADIADAEASIKALVRAGQALLDEAAGEAPPEGGPLAERVQALHAEVEAHWARITAAAAALDAEGGLEAAATALCAGAPEPPPPPSAELEALLAERQALRQQVGARNARVKQQIDRLRQALADIDVAGDFDVSGTPGVDGADDGRRRDDL